MTARPDILTDAPAGLAAAPPAAWPQIENPVTGERMVFLRSCRATGGQCVEVQFDLPPGAAGSPLHYHRRLHETFEVSSGSLEMTVGRRAAPRAVAPGELVIVPPGTPHAFRNASADWVTFTSVVTPAGQFERFLRAWYGLAQHGLVGATGMPRNPFYLALALHYADFAFPDVPDRVQRIVVGSLAGLARLTGAERQLDRHLASAPGMPQ
jgi:quercetin dioxygenase-like cupin family protein